MKIHSFESFGTVDGPGIRFIVFTQGCPLRCVYCHNPDTWNIEDATIDMEPQDVFKEVCKYRNFIRKGGITVSGGEPLMQAEQVKELFTLCRKEGIHTALDTAGVLLNDAAKELLEVTDLVLLDIKSITEGQFAQITGGGKLSQSVKFLDYLRDKGIKVWIRHVVVPTYTDDEELLKQLAEFVKGYDNVERVELLPYHDLSKEKYQTMGLKYPLGDLEPMSKSRVAELKKLFDR